MKAADAFQPENRTISAAKFKATCLQLMDELNEKDLTITVTKRGKPVMVARAPASAKKPFVSIVGRSPGIQILGDIVAPLPQEWTLPEGIREKPKEKGKKSKGKKK